MAKGARDFFSTRKKLGDLIVERGHVTREDLEKALEQQQATGKPLGEVLISLGIATESQLRDALAAQQSVEAWDLEQNPPDVEALQLVPVEFCVKHLVVPVRAFENTLTVAMQSAGDVHTIDRLYSLTHMRIEPVQASDAQLRRCLQEAFGQDDQEASDSLFESFVSQALEDVRDKQGAGKEKEVTEEETRPVIGMVNEIIGQAVEMRASDIHIEPADGEAGVRYRVDGRLVKVRTIPGSLMRMIAARIKIMADLDIANNRTPQDGRIELRTSSRSIDLRVSVLPTQYGSRVVIRILDRATALKSLDSLGFSQNTLDLFREIVSKPYGIVLVTGPTGSGKTTTLYAALNEVKDDEKNIMTCEDPIEYDLKGISQSQVNERAGLTFAAQLRAILRQDPDIILVGEIRDQETADTAVRAALTGHMVLSTLHSNDAPSAIPRLMDMGIDPYMLSTSLVGIVAQRLLRVVCKDCRQPRKITAPEKKMLAGMGYGHADQLWEGEGCKTCNGTGYRGRAGVHEILPVTDRISELILARSTSETLRDAAEPFGYRPLYKDAIERALAGDTSIEEVRRLIFLDTIKAQKATELALAG